MVNEDGSEAREREERVCVLDEEPEALASSSFSSRASFPRPRFS